MQPENDLFAHPVVQELRRQRDSLADANAVLAAQMRAAMAEREAMSRELEALRPPAPDEACDAPDGPEPDPASTI